ncbi:hypothetical protein ACFE04_001186 [Oxalis oulophora]
MPNLDQNSTKMLNLTVLQRVDPFIEEILITAAHVTFYEFNIDNSQWSRKDVEGSLFVVKRNTQPRFQFIVMNRRNTDNLVENILGDFEYEIQNPYLLYRNAAQEVNGIWFYNQQECEEVANLFSRILTAYSKVSPKPKASSKSEFEELEAVPTMSVMEGPLEPSGNPSNATEAPDNSAFANFFSAAMNMGNNTSNVTNSRQSYHPTSTVPSHVPGIVPSPMPTQQVPSAPQLAPMNAQTLIDSSDLMRANSRVTNLVKPSSFFTSPAQPSQLMTPQITTPLSSAPALQPPLNIQRPYGTPMLQPFPPPNPPPSLTPSSTSQIDGLVISRDSIRHALSLLAQDDQFIDLVCQALMKSSHI